MDRQNVGFFENAGLRVICWKTLGYVGNNWNMVVDLDRGYFVSI